MSYNPLQTYHSLKCANWTKDSPLNRLKINTSSIESPDAFALEKGNDSAGIRDSISIG